MPAQIARGLLADARSARLANIRAEPRVAVLADEPPPGPVLAINIDRWTGWRAAD